MHLQRCDIRHTLVWTALLVVVIVVAGSCFFGGGPDGLVAFTDRGSYVIPEGGFAQVRITLRNEGDRTVWVPRCGLIVPKVIEQRLGTQWQETSRIATVCPADRPQVSLALTTGKEFVDTLFGITKPGQYRVRILFGFDPAAEVMWTRTNTFVGK